MAGPDFVPMAAVVADDGAVELHPAPRDPDKDADLSKQVG